MQELLIDFEVLQRILNRLVSERSERTIGSNLFLFCLKQSPLFWFMFEDNTTVGTLT